MSEIVGKSFLTGEKLELDYFNENCEKLIEDNFKSMLNMLRDEYKYRSKILDFYESLDSDECKRLTDLWGFHIASLVKLTLSMVNHIRHYDFLQMKVNEKTSGDNKNRKVFTVLDLLKYSECISNSDDFFLESIYKDLIRKFVIADEEDARKE